MIEKRRCRLVPSFFLIIYIYVCNLKGLSETYSKSQGEKYASSALSDLFCSRLRSRSFSHTNEMYFIPRAFLKIEGFI